MERYAQTARELEEEAVEEAEGGEEEDGQELDLGMLGLVDPELLVMAFIEYHAKELLRIGQVSEELRCRFKEKFPRFMAVFAVCGEDTHVS